LKQRVRDALLGERMLASGMFNVDVLRQLVVQHESGQHDHSTPLWTLLMFDAFLKREAGAVRQPSGSQIGLAA
jgi:asparagine synthase (glutamine-hydrolysing)